MESWKTYTGARIAAPQDAVQGDATWGGLGAWRSQLVLSWHTMLVHCAGQQNCLRACQLSSPSSLPWTRTSTKHSNRHIHDSAPLFVQLPDRLFLVLGLSGSL